MRCAVSSATLRDIKKLTNNGVARPCGSTEATAASSRLVVESIFCISRWCYIVDMDSNGAGGRDRTCDIRFMRAMLYH